MNRDILVGLVALAIIALGAALYYGLSPSPAKAPSSTVTTTLTNPYTEQGDYYDISAGYPTTTPLGGFAGDEAVDAMQGWVISTIGEFKESLIPADEPVQGASDGHSGTLEITYRSFASSHTVSYSFARSQYTGGAHGGTSFKTFTFDTTTGVELALIDIFALGAHYLEALSKIAREKLPSILGDMENDQMLLEGTEPTAENFENWYLEGEVLVILFPPYAVAPFAAGPQTLSIPLVELMDVLKPEYRP